MKWPLIIFLLVALCASGCRQKRQSEANPVLPIEQVTSKPENYTHRLLTIQGCYVQSFERSTLQPCNDAKQHQLVWVDNAETEFTLRNTWQSSPRNPIPKELQSEAVLRDYLMFKYDEKRSNAAWNRLDSVGFRPTRVILYGQFDTVAIKNANTNTNDVGHGFGHLGQYENRLILVDVLEIQK